MEPAGDLLAYFEPVDHKSQVFTPPFHYSPLGSTVSFTTEKTGGKELEKAKLVIFSYPGSSEAALIRKQLYSLSSHFPGLPVTDLGALRKGKTKADTESGLKDVIAELSKMQKTLLIFGGDVQATYNVYKAYSTLEQTVNLCGVSAGIPLSTDMDSPSAPYLNKILLDPGNKLYEYSQLAYQAYYTSPQIIELIEQLFFNHLRLGILRRDIKEAEPDIRNSDILSFSMSSIRESDCPGNDHPGPNGLYAEEACQLGRYAGLSEKISCFFLNDIHSKGTPGKQASTLAAQIIWHFIQGFHQRKNEYPFGDIRKYQKFIVNVPGAGHDMHFYKSFKTGRWWLEVPYPGSKYERSLFAACTHSDYQIACAGEIPDRWWKNFQRLS